MEKIAGIEFPLGIEDITDMRVNSMIKFSAQAALYIHRMKKNREKVISTLKDQGVITDEDINNSIDSSIALEDGNSSSEVKECNDSTDKQEIMSYDNDLDSGIADTEHESMIECPKFHYKVSPKTGLVVSKDPFPGSSVSPLHCRDGVMHDNVVVN